MVDPRHEVGELGRHRCDPELPVEDAYAGLKWVHDHALELGIDADRIGIGGASAGAGLAAGLALLVRDRAEFEIAFQLLIYPMLDDRQATPSSSRRSSLRRAAAACRRRSSAVRGSHGGTGTARPSGPTATIVK